MSTAVPNFGLPLMPDTLQPYEKEILAYLNRPNIKVRSLDELAKSPWQSKLGGMPYLPKGAPNPLLKNFGGKDYYEFEMLFQLNLDEMPSLPDFPISGIMQFFVSHEEPWEDISRLIYHDKTITDTALLVTDFSDMPKRQFETDSEPTPNEGVAVGFEKVDFSVVEGMSQNTDLQELFDNVEEEDYWTSLMESLCDYLDELNQKYETFRQESQIKGQGSNCAQIGGNAFQFFNADPRDKGDHWSRHNRLLMEYSIENAQRKYPVPFQMGDVNPQFFIEQKALENSNFSEYLYHGMI